MHDEPTYPEQLTKRILARAVELDHIRSASYSITELRSIANEVGVSEAALEQALRELEPAVPPAGARTPRISLAVVTLAASAAGAIGGIIDVQTHYITSPIAALFMMGAGGLALSGVFQRGVARGWRRFQLLNAVLWAGYGATWLVTAFAGGAGMDSIETLITTRIIGFGWAISAAFGSLVSLVHARRARAASGNGDGDGELKLPLKRRIGEKLKTWIDTLTARTRVVDVVG